MPSLHRRTRKQTHCACPPCSRVAHVQVRIFRVFALLGSIAAARAAFETAEHMAKRLLTTWGTFIVEVRR